MFQVKALVDPLYERLLRQSGSLDPAKVFASFKKISLLIVSRFSHF